LMGFLQNDQA